jgi:hypothetical protein
MVELAPSLCQHIARQGQVIVDTAEAVHEAGDLLQAGLDVQSFPTLAQSLARQRPRPAGPVLFKSCGWGGWDLAAARLAARMHRQPLHANDDPPPGAMTMQETDWAPPVTTPPAGTAPPAGPFAPRSQPPAPPAKAPACASAACERSWPGCLAV